ncbi:unnamed protein product [Bursaphelenchus okinawaensis]|uniref:Uncharacterized protein n=1 Tax=Bursaphelenchus okinawaensis TaxID=465554 RepID=A0A811KT74_9BILA|nr:unnamed protein product [Bursaphelenchus okinawaensis]CAG9111801.1 unnamed protein product [Bursaphelenchus okinawaensis]
MDQQYHTEEERKAGRVPTETVAGSRRIPRKDRTVSENSGETDEWDEKKMKLTKAEAREIQRLFPTDRIRAKHEKPLPTHEPHSYRKTTRRSHEFELFQPKRFN